MNKFKQRLNAKKIERELSIKDGILVVDNSSCDGCESCVTTCPHSAINIITLSDAEVKRLPFKGRLKVRFKGRNKAFVNTDLCTACGLCIRQCHEFAIHKVKK